MVEPNRNTPRSICAGKLTTRNIAGLRQPLNSTSTMTTWLAKRTQETNGAAMPDSTRYLALVSRKENNTPVAITQEDRRQRRRLFVDVSGRGH